MKHFLFFFVALFALQTVNAQNIVDIFKLIPGKYVDDLTLNERNSLLKDKTLVKDDLSYSVLYDLRNGYLRMEQGYTEGQSGYGAFEVTFWNLKNKKLVAVSSVMGSNAGFHQNDFKFFEYQKGKLTELKTGYLKNYSSDFEKFIFNLLDDFTKKGLTKENKELLRYAQFTIDLPKEGKNIRVSFNVDPEEESSFMSDYSKFLHTFEKTFIFNPEREIFEN